MINSIVFIIIKNAFFFSFIFWIITFLLKYYYSNKQYSHKLNFYECGFKSITNIKIQYNINFILIILFLLIYDGEFLLLIPVALNISILNIFSIFLIIVFIVWLIITLLIDYIFSALEWQF